MVQLSLAPGGSVTPASLLPSGLIPGSLGRNIAYQREVLPHEEGGERNPRKEGMFLELRESHRTCVPLQGLRAPQAWGRKELRTGKIKAVGAWRGSEVTQMGSGQLNLSEGAGTVGSPRPPGALFVGGEAALPEILCMEVVEERKEKQGRSCGGVRCMRGSMGFGKHSGFKQEELTLRTSFTL